MKTLTVTATGRAAAPPDRIRLSLTLEVLQADYEAAMKFRRWATISCSRNASSVCAFS